MVATMFATGLWLTTFLSVRGLVLLLEDGRRSSSWREFLGEHLLHCILLTGLFVTACIAVYLDWQLWLLRSGVDLALDSKPWRDSPMGSGGTVGEAASHVARVAAFAVPAITGGFAVGLEASLRWSGRAWQRLGIAINDVRAMAEADAYLDAVVGVIGAERGVRKVTRRTAEANPEEFIVSNGEVFSREYAKGLQKYKPESNGNVSGYRPRGVLARWLASGFGIALALLASSGQGFAGDQGFVDVPHVEKVVWPLADAGTKPNREGMPQIIIAFDSSGYQKERVGTSVNAVRATLKGLAEARPADPRHRPTARVEIYLLSIDSLSEVVWSGTELTVGELDDAWWASVIAERQSYGACTSLASTWVKIRELIRARPDSLIQVALFTDLVAEEPQRSNPSKCGPRQLGPSAEVPWSELARVNLIRAYGVPSGTKAAWRKPLRGARSRGPLQDVRGRH